MPENFPSRKNRISIKTKFILINLPLTVLPLLIFGIFLTRTYDHDLIDRTRLNMAHNTMVIADRVGKILADSENCSNYLTVNINNIIGNGYYGSSGISDLATGSLITKELYSAKIIFKDISSIAFIDVNDRLYYSNVKLLDNQDMIKNSKYMKLLEKTTGESIWFGNEARQFLVTEENQKGVTLGKKVWKINTGETLGYLFVNVDMNAITKHFSNELVDYYLVDSSGSIITAKKELAYDKQFDVLKMTGGEQYIAQKQKILMYDWYIIGVTNLNLFNMERKGQISLLSILLATIIVISIIMSLSLTNIITRPIISLKRSAEKIADGNLEIRLNLKVKDEIGQLCDSFNEMVKRIKGLLIKVEKEEKKKREYELALIQEQVKPHFLYNTLDIIIKLSELGKSKEAQRVAKKLADYYRRSLSHSKEVISIGEEMMIVEDYLELQRMRYSDLFEYEMDIDKQLYDEQILKLTLQPLVENAIYHGLKYKEAPGRITIKGIANEGTIELCVIDNGIGIREDELENILELRNAPKNHFGIYSVDHRIRLFFGEQYGLELSSIYGDGTTVKITLPRRNTNDQNHDS